MESFLYRLRSVTLAAVIPALLVAQASCGPRDAGGEVAGTADVGPTLASGPETLPSPAGQGSAEPHLSASEDGVVLSWLEPEDRQEFYRLRMARWDGEAWNEATTVARGDDFFVNWADFPSVVDVGGTLVAHWLQRGDQGGYDYGVRVATSADGRDWSAPLTPHTDGTPTEHGFVSTFPHPDGGAGLVWLDGRRYAEGPDGSPATEEMTLRTRRIGPDGDTGPEILLDPRICDCCQTDAVTTARGPLVAYRDRSEGEIRDISVTRLVDGAWTEGRPVHEDGWHIAACPVNGPAAAARGEDVAVAWFTAARDTAAVKVAFSSDAGATFSPPVRVDSGDPAGRVDVVLLDDGSAVVSWIERVGDGAAELRARRVLADGRLGDASRVSAASAARASGFPQMVLHGGRLVFAWTDVGNDGTARVLVARAEPAR